MLCLVFSMKILLLEHPRSNRPERCNDIANTPLSSCLLTGYTAAMLLEEGHEVEIIEGFMDRLSYPEIRRMVYAFGPKILGVHMVYHWEDDKRLAEFLSEMKKEGAASFIAAYGFYPTFAFKEILAGCEAVDAVLLGEPELTFASVARSIAAGRPAHPPHKINNIPGLAMRGGEGDGKIISSPPETAGNPDRLPFPVRTAAMWRLPEVNILGSRGCYGRCAFCHINSFFGGDSRWRGRSPENIVMEIDALIAEKGVRDFYFTDPNFFGPGAGGQRRALRLAAMLKDRNINFGIETRANDIKDKGIAALAGAGLRHILIGFESGSDRSLLRMKKMTTVADNEKALETLRRHGIEPNVGFIMFEPDSTLKDIKTNFQFLKRNRLLHALPVTANVLYHHQIILKGTDAFRALEKEGRLRMETSHEGRPLFMEPGAGALAAVIGRAANLLFRRMDGIWSGGRPAPLGAQKTYAEINEYLVGLFEDTLDRLLAGEGPGVLSEDFIARAEEELEARIAKLGN